MLLKSVIVSITTLQVQAQNSRRYIDQNTWKYP